MNTEETEIGREHVQVAVCRVLLFNIHLEEMIANGIGGLRGEKNRV